MNKNFPQKIPIWNERSEIWNDKEGHNSRGFSYLSTPPFPLLSPTPLESPSKAWILGFLVSSKITNSLSKTLTLHQQTWVARIFQGKILPRSSGPHHLARDLKTVPTPPLPQMGTPNTRRLIIRCMYSFFKTFVFSYL